MAQFTAENRAEFVNLIGEITLTSETLSGKMGSNRLSPWDFVNTSTNGHVESAWKACKRQISSLSSEGNPWDDANEKNLQEAENLRKWERFLYLCLGYKTWKAQEDSRLAKKGRLESDLKRLIEENKTPAERIAELQAELAAI